MLDRDYSGLGELLADLVPTYDYHPWPRAHFIFRFVWEPEIVEFMETVSARRCETRRKSYLIPGELDRAAALNESTSGGASIRFGHLKTGHGFEKERRDFCLVGGAYRGKTLTLMYRRLDILGGLFYDIALIREVEKAVGPIKHVVIHAMRADAYTRKGGSNEKLYARLRKYFRTGK